MNKHRFWVTAVPFILLLITACNRPSPTAQVVVLYETALTPISTLSSATPWIQAEPIAQTATPFPDTPPPIFTATPFYTGVRSETCGQLLPLLPSAKIPQTTNLTSDANALANLEAIMPDVAKPAMTRILEAPETVGLVLFRAGEEANGVYLNAEMQMPLASVSKVVTLVAYAEAVTAGELNPTQVIPIEAIEPYYLPNFDLGAHPHALRELDTNGRIFPNPPAVLLDELPWMMVRHSSNASADYLHMLLGQARIEETAVSLNLTSHTAPCTFLGQFLAMGNHVRSAGSDQDALDTFISNPAIYADAVTLLADAYVNDLAFRADEQAWRQGARRPSLNIQRSFSSDLNTHGTPLDYANLMARIAQNGLSSGESSFLARRHLEWPMQFAGNQALFSNLGYKNGSLPGILTTVYYAYPLGDSAPIVIALFYQDLPNRTYQQWRNTLPHDEFARWLLAEPGAIPALKAVVNP
jgi:D-alanyl-D-alanine carboxypeptidase